MTSVYRGMSQEELDAAYNNQAAVPDFQDLVARWRRDSADLARSAGARLDLAYGDKPRQRIDVFASDAAAAPLLAFIHGGYWQGGEKRSVGFLAEGPLSRGFAVALVEYTVAPVGRLAEMVAEIRSSIVWLRESAAELGFDPDRIVLAGHSAGAQLLCTALQKPGVIGGIAISGLYDLEPIRLSYLNAELGLSPEDVNRFSPLRCLPIAQARLCVAVGASELPELVRQSEEFATASRSEYLPLEGHDHFSVLDELAKPNGRLCTLLDTFIES